ncbi:MAG: hypothetical protein ACLP9L_20285 [Thermoguttaceae bacterium]
MKPIWSVALVASLFLNTVSLAAEPKPATTKQITNSIGRCQTRPIGLWWHHLLDSIQ